MNEFEDIIEEIRNLTYDEQGDFLFVLLGVTKSKLKLEPTKNEIISTYKIALDFMKERRTNK